MTDEDLIEGVVDVVRREMGPIGLIARVVRIRRLAIGRMG
jgi:hypothetical protein